MGSLPRHYRLGLLSVVAVGLLARAAYWAAGVRFSAEPLDYYIQYIDPELLRHDLLRSLFYLRDQPPGFNAFLGVVVKLFPVHFAWAFAAAYFAFGVAFAVTLYTLLVRLGVRVWLAAAVTIAFLDSPIAILYENWLFYTFPVAVILCASALFLHRWLAGRRFADALVFFSLLAVGVYWRNLLHPLWMVATFVALFVVERAQRRQIVRAAAGPLLAVAALLVKHFIVFHAPFQGRPMQQMNLAGMTAMRIPEAERARLVAAHTLVISDVPIVAGPNVFRRYVPTPPKTGVPVLDQEYKPKSGFPNWNASIYVPIGELYGKDARWALANRPRYYLEGVAENVARYVLPSDQSDPFNTRRYANRLCLQPLLTWWNRLLSWQRAPNRTPWAHVIAFPLLLLFAVAVVVRRWRDERALALTVAFALYSTLWVSAATLLLSYGDHNRYRFKVSAFYCLFFALAVERALVWWETRGTRDRGARPTPGETRR